MYLHTKLKPENTNVLNRSFMFPFANRKYMERDKFVTQVTVLSPRPPSELLKSHHVGVAIVTGCYCNCRLLLPRPSYQIDDPPQIGPTQLLWTVNCAESSMILKCM